MTKRIVLMSIGMIMALLMVPAVFTSALPGRAYAADSDIIDLTRTHATDPDALFMHFVTDTGMEAGYTQPAHVYGASGHTGDLYCIQIGIEVKSLSDYTEYSALRYISQAQIDRAAIGLHYIYANCSGSDRYLNAQIWVWDSVLGSDFCDTYFRELGITGNISCDRHLAGGSEAVYQETLAYWEAHRDDFICTGTAFVKDGSQGFCLFDAQEKPKTGKLSLRKAVASNKALTDLCPENYSLAGAEYYVSTGSDGSGYTGKLTTDANGETNVLELEAGRYYVKEVKAPAGYMLDREYHQVDVVSGESAAVSCADEPLFDPLVLKVEKKAAEGADKNLPLEGAEYTVKYYKELVDDVTGLTPFRTWVFRTDSTGIFRLADEWQVGGDELFHNKAGSPVGLYGTYTFEEAKAPAGFARTEGIISIQQVKAGAEMDQVQVLRDVTDIEQPQTVSIEIDKTDAVTGENVAQGGNYGGTLAGAVYEVYFYDPMQAEDIKVGEITTDEAGHGILEGLKPGKYSVKEKTAPAGYLINSETREVYARITEENTANFNYIVDSQEQPITAEVWKTSFDGTGARTTVGGAVLELQDMEGRVLDRWTSEEGRAHIMQGIPAGEYRIVEKEAPEGYFPQKEPQLVTVSETAETQEIDVFNEAVPEIVTRAMFGSGAKESEALEEVTVIDEVSYSGLIPGKEYTVKGRLVDQEDERKVIATGETTFTPDVPDGTVEVRFTFDASGLEGKSLVVFEDLYKEGIKLASHAEINDEEQTVEVRRAPKTGDSSHAAFYGAAGLAAISAAVILFVRRKEER